MSSINLNFHNFTYELGWQSEARLRGHNVNGRERYTSLVVDVSKSVALRLQIFSIMLKKKKNNKKKKLIESIMNTVPSNSWRQ